MKRVLNVLFWKFNQPTKTCSSYFLPSLSTNVPPNYLDSLHHQPFTWCVKKLLVWSLRRRNWKKWNCKGEKAKHSWKFHFLVSIVQTGVKQGMKFLSQRYQHVCISWIGIWLLCYFHGFFQKIQRWWWTSCLFLA